MAKVIKLKTLEGNLPANTLIPTVDKVKKILLDAGITEQEFVWFMLREKGVIDQEINYKEQLLSILTQPSQMSNGKVMPIQVREMLDIVQPLYKKLSALSDGEDFIIESDKEWEYIKRRIENVSWTGYTDNIAIFLKDVLSPAEVSVASLINKKR